MAVSARPVSRWGSCDNARTQRECCLSESVDVRGLSPMSSVIVALCARSCWCSLCGILLARLRLRSQTMAESVVDGRRIVEAGLKRPELGVGGRG